MNRKRFFGIRSHFHVINNMDTPTNNHNKFIKVRPLYNRIKKACLKLPTEKYLSVDEQIVPFKGHLSVKQYIRGKPNPWGIKFFYYVVKVALYTIYFCIKVLCLKYPKNPEKYLD